MMNCPPVLVPAALLLPALSITASPAASEVTALLRVRFAVAPVVSICAVPVVVTPAVELTVPTVNAPF